MAAAQNCHFLFVSGLSGSGKTTLGEALKKESGYVHFNVDVWAFGGDPIEQSDAVPNAEMMKNIDPEVKSSFDNMIANGFGKISKGEAVPMEVWSNFFSRLCPVVSKAREENVGKNMIVSFSVYLRSVRDYIRQQLGPELKFVVLNPSIEKVGERKVQHLKNTATARGMTLGQFLKSLTPGSENQPDLEDNVIAEMLTQQAKAGAVGFEAAAEDEPNTLAVGDMTVPEIHQAVLEFTSGDKQ